MIPTKKIVNDISKLFISNLTAFCKPSKSPFINPSDYPSFIRLNKRSDTDLKEKWEKEPLIRDSVYKQACGYLKIELVLKKKYQGYTLSQYDDGPGYYHKKYIKIGDINREKNIFRCKTKQDLEKLYEIKFDLPPSINAVQHKEEK